MSISSLLTPKNVEFSKNDQLIHDYILKYPQRTKLMTIQKLASNTGTSIAAVQRLEQMGYTLWTPYRKNMKNAQKHNKHYLMAFRRTIESDFSLLSYYNAKNNRARSLAGFQERLEVAILAYNMAYCLERFN